MKPYGAIFFDLDHTLWDFDKNSAETISELFLRHRLESRGVPDAEEFIDRYRSINASMWDQYHRNEISRDELSSGRFRNALMHYQIDDVHLAGEISEQYLALCPGKRNLFPGAIEILDYLNKKYQLHIITNGFREVQYLKIRNAGIERYFDHIHISEEIGYKKPEPEIFNYAVKKSGLSAQQCIMIGDNVETDIAGAINANIDHIYFNPGLQQRPAMVKRMISRLPELKDYL